MRRIAALAAVLLIPAVSTAAFADALKPTPAVHEEITRAWDRVTAQLRDLGSLWRDHFRGEEAPSERPLITLMLRHREELRLSTDQVRSLEKLRGEFQSEAVKRESDIRIAEMDLSTLLDAKPADLENVEVKVREIERLKGDMRLDRIRAIEQAKALLSAEQQTKLNELAAGTRFSSRPNGKLSR